MTTSNLTTEIIRKVCRLYFEQYRKPADLLDIVNSLNAERVPHPLGNNEWDVFNIGSILDLGVKLCPEIFPEKGPKEGGKVTINIKRKYDFNNGMWIGISLRSFLSAEFRS